MRHWSYREDAALIYFASKPYHQPIVNWLNRLVVMGVIGPDEWNWQYGKISGYPECCIKWFIFMDKMLVGRRGIAVMTDYLYGRPEGRIDYVKCPKCLMKDSNKNN